MAWILKDNRRFDRLRYYRTSGAVSSRSQAMKEIPTVTHPSKAPARTLRALLSPGGSFIENPVPAAAENPGTL